MSTGDLILLAAAAAGHITADAATRNSWRWKGVEVDFDCGLRLDELVHHGLVDRTSGEVTADGNLALLKGRLS